MPEEMKATLKGFARIQIEKKEIYYTIFSPF